MNNRSIETIIAEFQETGSTDPVNKIYEMASVNKEAQLSEIIDKLPTETPSFHAKLIWDTAFLNTIETLGTNENFEEVFTRQRKNTVETSLMRKTFNTMISKLETEENKDTLQLLLSEMVLVPEKIGLMYELMDNSLLLDFIEDFKREEQESSVLSIDEYFKLYVKNKS